MYIYVKFIFIINLDLEMIKLLNILLIIFIISHTTNCDLNIFESDTTTFFDDSDFYHDDNDKLYLFSKVSSLIYIYR